MCLAAGALGALQQDKTCEISKITATSQAMKAKRGTKRVCQECAVPFYDLSRTPIVCPSCGAHYALPASPTVAETRGRGAPFASKTGWRGSSFKRPAPEPDAAVEDAATEDAAEEAPSPASNGDAVLEEETDETDISGLLGHDEAEPKER